MRPGNDIEMLRPGPDTPVPAGTHGVMLALHPDKGWEIEWENGVNTFFPGNGDEIASKAAPGNQRCDFCPTDDPTWEHRCHDSSSVMVALSAGRAPISMGQNMSGSWAACDVCHRLIEADKRDKLARRAAKKIAQEAGGLPLSVVLTAVRQAHRQYWDNRVGPGFPIRQEAYR